MRPYAAAVVSLLHSYELDEGGLCRTCLSISAADVSLLHSYELVAVSCYELSYMSYVLSYISSELIYAS